MPNVGSIKILLLPSEVKGFLIYTSIFKFNMYTTALSFFY